MLAWQRYGNGATPESTGLKGDKLVGNYYVEFNTAYKTEIDQMVAKGTDLKVAEKEAPILLEAQQMLQKWEAGDEEVVSLWKKMNGWVYEGFDVTYKNLGVDFAYLGTRFLAAQETMISQEYREMVWQSRMEDLIASRAITGALGNWMRASVEAAGLSLENMKETVKIDFSGDMHDAPRGWKHVWSAGQGVGGVTEPESITDIAATLRQEYAQAVDDQSKGSRYLAAHNTKDGA